MAERYSTSQVLFIILVVMFGVYMNNPPPELSSRLLEWRYSGKYFGYQGLAVFYKDDYGSGDANSVLVCIHGFPTSTYDFSKIWGSLKSKFGRVIAVDMLDLGFSDKPANRDFSVKEQATIIELLLQNLGVKRIHILAHDLGDTVALELLARFDEQQPNEPGRITIESFCLSNGG
ncbi:Mesoderm-specific transcript-like protein [Exaiptasia diaphana]|nr:Mesoderm-specific transcript-like protein [Exaiptasia diaphana]